MTVVALDDTDSREHGMCTTYLATRLAERVEAAGGTVQRRLLVRLNPAVEHKTRGNAALALHTDLPATEAFALAREELSDLAIDADPRTSPGVVVADLDDPYPRADDGPGSADSDAIPDGVADFAARAMRERLDLEEALGLIEANDWAHAGYAADGCEVAGRGRIGALAAVGAPAAFDDWTYEHISYREFDRCGTPREVDRDSVFDAADWVYPAVWDTVDREEGEAVCVPNAPGPILHGIRGDDPDACRAVAARIESERVARSATFLTNQGTDAHVEPGAIGELRDGAGYRVDGTVASDPETKRGGHVFFALQGPEGDAATGEETVDCAAFEPTKRFRERVRALRVGDEVTVCGEFDDGTIKLEKLAIRDLVETEPATPTCPDCGRSMSSAGRNQGYRCRDCGTSAPGKVQRELDRDLERGWYEVPPCARRHVAKPLVRDEVSEGSPDAPVHTEK
ncbi:TiaS agmantine-binding domain-containing protein [Haloparvum sp. PAK95]|uniref:TiaS agmantine-binding domain-containing protein n=1 Tax=Haloparvum sp. PAK95 TaxID=3418962 RepID=UPI003D2EE46D